MAKQQNSKDIKGLVDYLGGFEAEDIIQVTDCPECGQGYSEEGDCACNEATDTTEELLRG